MALQMAHLDAAAQELITRRAATAQAEVPSGMSLADTKLLSKPCMYSGEFNGKERLSTWSFKMKAYCAALAPRLGELG